MPEALARRDLFRGRGSARAAPSPLRPPTAIEEDRFAALCDGCAACVPACPEGIVRLDRAHRPVLQFLHGECTFCAACAEACPTGALVAEGARPWTAHAAIGPACLAVSGVACRSCGDACPTSALSFVPRPGGRYLPAVIDDACTGCGACVAVCPVGAVAVRPAPENPRTGASS